MCQGFKLEVVFFPLTCPEVGWSVQKHNKVMTISASMFPLIPVQRADDGRSSDVLEVAGSVNCECVQRLQVREWPRLEKAAAAENHWGMLGLLFRSQSGKRDFKKNVTTLLSLYLIWCALPLRSKQLSFYLFVQKWKKTELWRKRSSGSHFRK